MPSTKQKTNPKTPFFERMAAAVTRVAGSPYAFIVALIIIVAWGISGPVFGFSDTWQLVINTGTTIITFLMVFVIQQTQNKDTVALHLKLNELIACNELASNRLIDIEDLTDEELQVAKKFYIKLAKLARNDSDLYGTHSLDDANRNHEQKMNAGSSRKKNTPHAGKK
ncbi:MAG TPA: low affinity iron permease family protein [Flavitalea sp.]|nr:low affinity iron permease family protein [Flavitalea sp.]